MVERLHAELAERTLAIARRITALAGAETVALQARARRRECRSAKRVMKPSRMSQDHHALFQLGPDATPYRKLTSEGVRVETSARARNPRRRRGGAARLERTGDDRHQSSAAPRPSPAARQDPRRSGGDRQRQVRRLRSPEERQHRRRRRAADVPGHRHRDRHRQEGPAASGPTATTKARSRQGIRGAYEKKNLRYSQVAPLSMFEEKNTGDNLPAQIEISAEGEDSYKFLFIAKGGGSANKSFLYPGDAVDPDPRPPDRVPEGKDPHPRHRRLPALSPRDRHRRHAAPS